MGIISDPQTPLRKSVKINAPQKDEEEVANSEKQSTRQPILKYKKVL